MKKLKADFPIFQSKKSQLQQSCGAFLKNDPGIFTPRNGLSKVAAELRGMDPFLRNHNSLKRLIYLDNGATTQKPQCVIDAMTHFYEHDNANVHRGIYLLSQKATMAYEKAHETVARFIGASMEEIIFNGGTTEGLNGLARSLGSNLNVGDEIVLTVMEHHSNLIPWQEIAREKGARLKFIPLTDDYRLDLTKAKELITAKTKIVSVTHMSNVLGTINPISELALLAHAVGAVLVVDAAQSVAHLPINVKELDCDYLVFSGHKMAGPTGIGVLYGKKKLLEKLPPFEYGGGMVKEVTFEKATWNDLPWKFEAGTPPIAEAIGLMAAIEYLEKISMENIATHGHELVQYGLQKMSAISGLILIGPSTVDERGPIFSFTLDGIHPHDVSELLDREGIAVRAGNHCARPLLSVLRGISGEQSTVRASFYIYNDNTDMDALVAAILKIKKRFA